MTTTFLIACIGMITGCFMLLGLTPMAFTAAIFGKLTDRPKSLRDEIGEFTRRKKPSYLRRELVEVQAILKATGRTARFPMLCALSLFCFAVGASIAVMLSNLFLVPVLGVGSLFLPFWWVNLTASHFKRDIAAELETALGIITTAYLRNEDILTAVEENLPYLNPPALSVFEGFVSRVRLLDPDVTAALYDLKTRIDNAVYTEWCDALIACQHDRSLKTTLTPMVSKLSDMRVVNGELEIMVFEPRKEFILMQALVIGNIPLLYFLNQDWYHTLMHTPPGQLVLTICAAVMFVATAFVIKLTQPVEYRR